MISEFFYTVATETEVDDLLEGHELGTAFPWPSYHTSRQIPAGATGVLWKKGDSLDDPIQPLILVAREEDQRRLCGRYAQLRSDLSPLTAWCYLFTPDRFEMLKSPSLKPNFQGLQAAWCGLIVAETQMLSELPLGSVRFTACLATQTFAIARASGLWMDLSETEILRRFNASNNLFKSDVATPKDEVRAEKVRTALQPIWRTLALVSTGLKGRSEMAPLVASLQGLQLAREHKDRNEVERFARPLVEVIPEARGLFRLSEIAPEQRLHVFDQIIDVLNKLDMVNQSVERSALALAAGYLATVAAGGSPTLTLASNLVPQWPEILAWAYVVGGIGEKVFWTSSFDGLGRLVSRELMRPFIVEDPPTCDFALDEAIVLADPKLKDPLVHLRIKQAKVATIALLPGVNVVSAINGARTPELKPHSQQTTRSIDSLRDSRGLAGMIADSIWPIIRPRVEECIQSAQDQEIRSSVDRNIRNKRRPAAQLDLRNSKK